MSLPWQKKKEIQKINKESLHIALQVRAIDLNITQTKLSGFCPFSVLRTHALSWMQSPVEMVAKKRAFVVGVKKLSLKKKDRCAHVFR